MRAKNSVSVLIVWVKFPFDICLRIGEKILVLSWIRNRLRWRCTQDLKTSYKAVKTSSKMILISSAELRKWFSMFTFSFTILIKILILHMCYAPKTRWVKKMICNSDCLLIVCGIIRIILTKFRSDCDKFLFSIFGAPAKYQQQLSILINLVSNSTGMEKKIN